MNLAVDASALLAILLDEPEAEQYQEKLLSAANLWISPVNWWEVQVIMQGHHHWQPSDFAQQFAYFFSALR